MNNVITAPKFSPLAKESGSRLKLQYPDLYAATDNITTADDVDFMIMDIYAGYISSRRGLPMSRVWAFMKERGLISIGLPQDGQMLSQLRPYATYTIANIFDRKSRKVRRSESGAGVDIETTYEKMGQDAKVKKLFSEYDQKFNLGILNLKSAYRNYKTKIIQDYIESLMITLANDVDLQLLQRWTEPVKYIDEFGNEIPEKFGYVQNIPHRDKTITVQKFIEIDETIGQKDIFIPYGYNPFMILPISLKKVLEFYLSRNLFGTNTAFKSGGDIMGSNYGKFTSVLGNLEYYYSDSLGRGQSKRWEYLFLPDNKFVEAGLIVDTTLSDGTPAVMAKALVGVGPSHVAIPYEFFPDGYANMYRNPLIDKERKIMDGLSERFFIKNIDYNKIQNGHKYIYMANGTGFSLVDSDKAFTMECLLSVNGVDITGNDKYLDILPIPITLTTQAVEVTDPRGVKKVSYAPIDIATEGDNLPQVSNEKDFNKWIALKKEAKALGIKVVPGMTRDVVEKLIEEFNNNINTEPKAQVDEVKINNE